MKKKFLLLIILITFMLSSCMRANRSLELRLCGAYASSKVYAEIVGGMSYAPSIGGSITYYATGQTDWFYGRANMTIVTNPYQKSWYDQFYPRPYA